MLSSVPQSELLTDHLAKRFSDLAMSRDRRLPLVDRIAVEVVPPAVSREFAPGLLQLSNKRLTLHTSSSTGCRWAAAGAGGLF